MNTLKDFIKAKILSYNSQLDVTDSSPLADILINPSTAMLDEFVTQLNYVYQILGITDPSILTTSELDAVASNFLVFRQLGTNATGSVEMYYNVPADLTIPAGTKFTTGGGESYSSTKTVTISKATMEANIWNFPLYSTGPILVQADEAGERFSIAPNTITATSFTPTPTSVTNSTGFSGGTDTETNEEFASRFFASVITRSYGSASSIQVALTEQFPTIQKISVAGMEDDEMLRDVAYSGMYLYTARKVIDYYAKTSGMNEAPYPESRAFWTVFYDNPSTSGLYPDLPTVEEFVTEFNGGQYAGIFTLDSARKTQLNTDVILEDAFTSSLASRWITTDAATSVGVLRDVNEIKIDGSKVRLGNTVTSSGVDNMVFTIGAETVYDLINAFEGLGVTPQRHIDTYSDLQGIWS